MKDQVRVIAIDDGSFDFRKEYCIGVGLAVRLPNYLEGCLSFPLTIDGDDVNDHLVGALAKSRFRDGAAAIMTDGITLGGFGVLDLDLIRKETGLPVITFTRDAPSLPAMRDAMQKHIPEWEERMKLVESSMPSPMTLAGGATVYIAERGMGRADAEELVQKSIIQGNVPDPLRMAHIIATGMAKGESSGRA
jgi:endonuclease V-like protein UPF0215 family